MGTSAPRRGLQDHNCDNNAGLPTKTSVLPWSRRDSAVVGAAIVVGAAAAIVAAKSQSAASSETLVPVAGERAAVPEAAKAGVVPGAGTAAEAAQA